MVRDMRQAEGRAGPREQGQSQEGGTAQHCQCQTKMNLRPELRNFRKCLLNHQLYSGLWVYCAVILENWQQCVPLHMVTQPEISICSNTLSQNILAKRELTVLVGTALFLDNRKHCFMSCILDCFRTHLLRKAALPLFGLVPSCKVFWGFRSSS